MPQLFEKNTCPLSMASGVAGGRGVSWANNGSEASANHAMSAGIALSILLKGESSMRDWVSIAEFLLSPHLDGSPAENGPPSFRKLPAIGRRRQVSILSDLSGCFRFNR